MHQILFLLSCHCHLCSILGLVLTLNLLWNIYSSVADTKYCPWNCLLFCTTIFYPFHPNCNPIVIRICCAHGIWILCLLMLPLSSASQSFASKNIKYLFTIWSIKMQQLHQIQWYTRQDIGFFYQVSHPEQRSYNKKMSIVALFTPNVATKSHSPL